MASDTLRARVEEFSDHVTALRSHYTRLAALTNQTKRSHMVTEDEAVEIEAEALIVEGMVNSIGVRYAAMPPQASASPGPTSGGKATATASGCVFSEAERNSVPQLKVLIHKYKQLRAAATAKLTILQRAVQTQPLQPRSLDRPSRSSDAPPPGGGGPGEDQRLQLIEHNIDERLAEEKRRELSSLAEQMAELHQLKAEFHSLVAEQEEGLGVMESHAAVAADRVEVGREQLVKASRYKLMAGAWVGGAVLGALIAGPVGFIAGAKSAGAIAGIAVGGSVVGGATTGAISKVVHSNNVDFDEVRAPPPPPSTAAT